MRRLEAGASAPGARAAISRFVGGARGKFFRHDVGAALDCGRKGLRRVTFRAVAADFFDVLVFFDVDDVRGFGDGIAVTGVVAVIVAGLMPEPCPASPS